MSEVREASISIGSQVVAETVPPPAALQGLRRQLSREREVAQPSVDNEFSNTFIRVLEPLSQVKIQVPVLVDQYGRPFDVTEETVETEEVDFTDRIKKEFEYYSRTRDLEVGTEKTEVLQKIADKITEGRGFQARVVIMNKGKEPEAFVAPEGTIFVSQSLLNKLDTLDEVAGVVAHEIGHIINKTFERKVQAGNRKTLGVGWIHEATSDALSAELLERAGFNTLAFASAIEKAVGPQRGTEHQSGLSRASEGVGQHLAVHYRTSSLEQMPKPVVLAGEARETNIRVFREITEKVYFAKKKEELPGKTEFVFERLHPRDLTEAYKDVLRSYRPLEVGVLQACNEVLLSRLKEVGYKEAEGILFLRLIAQRCDAYGGNNYLFREPQTLVDVSEILVDFEREDKIAKMTQELFFGTTEERFPDRYVWSEKGPTERFLEIVKAGMYDPSFGPRFYKYRGEWFPYASGDGIPVTEDTLIAFLAKVQQLEDKARSEYFGRDVSLLLLEYVDLSYLRGAAEVGEEVDRGQLREQLVEFFKRAKELGIEANGDAVRSYIDEKAFKKGSQIIFISRENQEIALEAFFEAFGISGIEKAEKEFGFEDIDRFFEESKEFKPQKFNDLLNALRETLGGRNADDSERLKYVEYINQKISSLALESEIPILKFLENVGRYKTGSSWSPYRLIKGESVDPTSNDLVMKLNLRIITGLALFRNDGNEFYTYMQKVMEEGEVDLGELSWTQLLNLCSPLLSVDKYPGNGPWTVFYKEEAFATSFGTGLTVKDYERFFGLPFLQAIRAKEGELDFSSIGELNQYLSDGLKKVFFEFSNKEDDNLFNDTLVSLVFGGPVRQNLLKILERGVAVREYGDLYDFITTYYPDGVQKDSILREINKAYLRSPQVSFNEKVDYLFKFFDKVGPEGMVMVAEEIEDIATYTAFRERLGEQLEKYLEGSKFITTVAELDFLTSILGHGSRWVLDSARTDQGAREKESTYFAQAWFHALFSRYLLEERIPYDPGSGKFIVAGRKRREIFRTVADTFTFLKNLSPLQRFAVAHKALTESGGSLSTAERRQDLAKTLTRSLALKQGFISSVLTAALEGGDAKLLAFPTSNMLGPLLFRAFGINEVERRQLSREWISKEEGSVPLSKILSRKDILRLLRSPTRDVVVFGNAYKDQPSSPASKMAQESYAQHVMATQMLESLLTSRGEEAQEAESMAGLEPALEALVKGVEASGAIGVRSLQLATQLHRFSKKVEARLSDSFDSNPGLNKLLFWENLLRVAQDNGEATEFLKRARIDGYLGGGSLYTVYAATLTVGGEQRRVAVKMLNPNALAFVKDSSALARKALEEVSGQGGRGSRSYAQLGLLLVDLAKQWSLEDINDPNFAQDDDKFQETIKGFNQETGTEIFYAPGRVLTSFRLKVEERAEGETLNKILKNGGVDSEVKRKALEGVTKFFVYQLRRPVLGEDGKEHFLVHSDPHVGNYVIDRSDDQMRIGVIDRSMYLKLSPENVEVLDHLLMDGDNTRFLNAFVNRTLDVNKVRNRFDRTRVWVAVWSRVGKEYGAQTMRRGGVDNVLLLRAALAELANKKLEVPLELRLMIRNISAMKSLLGQYGLKLKDYVQIAS